jgi:hypothetical protein
MFLVAAFIDVTSVSEISGAAISAHMLKCVWYSVSVIPRPPPSPLP